MADNSAHTPDRADTAQTMDGHAMDGHAMATTQAHGGPEEHGAEATLLGLNGGAIVSAAMLVFIIILLVKKVPSLIGGALDGKIAVIRRQLEEAATLRREAEALKAEYQARMASAAKDIDAMRASAEGEAADLIAAARLEAESLVARRQKMAEDKIGAAERAAVADVRNRAVSAATAAAATLIGQVHDAKADTALVNDSIGKLAH